jgi:hypothetical protein
MRALLVCLAFLVTLPTTYSAELIETDVLRLQLKGDWKREPGETPEQFVLVSKMKDAALTISTMKFKTSGVDLEMMVDKLREFRMLGERDAAKEFNRKVEIADPLKTKGDRGWHLQYFGRDNTGRTFRYYGIVVPGKLLNIYAESPTADLKQLDAVLQEVFAGVQF